MTNYFKLIFFQAGKWSVGLFFVLFIFRLMYGYASGDSGSLNDNDADFFSTQNNLRRNYASEYSKTKTDVQTQYNQAANQKFEKTASIKTKSSQFENDEKLIKVKTKSFNAVIQYEQNLGQSGNRQIHLMIGVNPVLFDSFYLEIQKIGNLKAKEITKVDKTNEYKKLNAKKVSIEKTLQSLNELKSKGGQISDFVTLNDKILEVEGKLQELGVELGNFDSENEFCTVKLSLYEGTTGKDINILHRVKIALEWTIKYFAIIIFSLFGLLLVIFLFLNVISKIKSIS